MGLLKGSAVILRSADRPLNTVTAEVQTEDGLSSQDHSAGHRVYKAPIWADWMSLGRCLKVDHPISDAISRECVGPSD